MSERLTSFVQMVQADKVLAGTLFDSYWKIYFPQHAFFTPYAMRVPESVA